MIWVPLLRLAYPLKGMCHLPDFNESFASMRKQGKAHMLHP